VSQRDRYVVISHDRLTRFFAQLIGEKHAARLVAEIESSNRTIELAPNDSVVGVSSIQEALRKIGGRG
jgi:hypothetical protein